LLSVFCLFLSGRARKIICEALKVRKKCEKLNQPEIGKGEEGWAEEKKK
jgi:hypothetical protein